MVFMRQQHCIVCNHETSHVNGDCTECKNRDAVRLAMKPTAHRPNMTLEERVKALEDWVDNYQPRYIPPPTY